MKTANFEEQLPRQITRLGIWLLAINGIIGAGIFGLGSKAAAAAGWQSPMMFVLCGVILIPIILSVSSVASYFKNTGGPILYARETFGSLAGFQVGWAFYISRITACAANMNLLVASLLFLIPDANATIWRPVLIAAICGFLIYINILGTRKSMNALGWMTILKFIPLLLIVLVGLKFVFGGAPEAILSQSTLPEGIGFSEIGPVTLLLIYAFVGWESALVPAGEAVNPKRDMPYALIAALVISTVLYFLIQKVSIAVLPDIANTERPLVEVGKALMGNWGGYLLLIGVVVSVGGNIAGAMFSTPRMTYSMATDPEGGLPDVFAKIHPTYNTPVISILIFGALMFIMALVGEFAWLAGMAAVVRIILYLVSIFTLFKLKKRGNDDNEVFSLPGGWLIPGLAIVICIWLLMQTTWYGAFVTFCLLAVGSLLYYLKRGKLF